MIFSGNNYRDIYSQDSDFIIDFDIFDYTSNDFTVGLYNYTVSGTQFWGLHFISGLISENGGNIVGSFNGRPININASKNINKLEYSINDIPISRQITDNNVYNKIGIITRDGGYADVITNLYGNIPGLRFDPAYSNSGVSGTIYNSGDYQVKIFDLYSTAFTGVWNYSTGINDGETGEYFINSANTLISGESIRLYLDTNFGSQYYDVPIISDALPSGTSESYVFASLALASGNNRIVETQEEFLYMLPYITDSSLLNIYFDYNQNRTGDALVYQTGGYTGQYSGWLDAISGFCSGTLYSSNAGSSTSSYTLDAYNTKNVTFTNPSQIQYSAYATGRLVYTYNYYEDLNNNVSRPRPEGVIPCGVYMGDLGGYFGNVTITGLISGGQTHDLWLEKSIYSGDRNITGTISSQSQSGRYVFSIDSYQASGYFIKETPITSDTFYETQSFEGRFYRGMAYCFLPNDYSFIVTGKAPVFGDYVITGEINSRYNCLLFKDVPNFSGAGLYVFSGEISGKILDKNLAYLLRDGSFGIEDPLNEYGHQGFNSLRYYMLRGMLAYDKTNLHPFSGISDYICNLYAGDPEEGLNSFQITGKPIDFSQQGFVAHPAQMPNNLYYDNNLNYGAGGSFAKPHYTRSVATDFTGILPFPITGYIQRGYFRHYVATGSLANMYLEEEYTPYNVPTSQSSKTNINNLYTNTFLGSDPDLEAKRTIIYTGLINVNQTLDPTYTGFLESGYFNVSSSSSGLRSGIFSGFAKYMPDIWKVYVADEISGSYQEISVAPFILNSGRYRMENIPIVGDSEKYIRINYSGAGYGDISGIGDQGELSFTVSSYSGVQIIRE